MNPTTDQLQRGVEAYQGWKSNVGNPLSSASGGNLHDLARRMFEAMQCTSSENPQRELDKLNGSRLVSVRRAGGPDGPIIACTLKTDNGESVVMAPAVSTESASHTPHTATAFSPSGGNGPERADKGETPRVDSWEQTGAPYADLLNIARQLERERNELEAEAIRYREDEAERDQRQDERLRAESTPSAIPSLEEARKVMRFARDELGIDGERPSYVRRAAKALDDYLGEKSSPPEEPASFRSAK